MTYDRADWHYGGDFPDGLPPECGATHIGMFLGWAIKRDLVGELHREHSAEAIAGVRDGSISGRDFLLDSCDEKFTEEELSEEGNRFAKSYFESRFYVTTTLAWGLDVLRSTTWRTTRPIVARSRPSLMSGLLLGERPASRPVSFARHASRAPSASRGGGSGRLPNWPQELTALRAAAQRPRTLG